MFNKFSFLLFVLDKKDCLKIANLKHATFIFGHKPTLKPFQITISVADAILLKSNKNFLQILIETETKLILYK